MRQESARTEADEWNNGGRPTENFVCKRTVAQYRPTYESGLSLRARMSGVVRTTFAEQAYRALEERITSGDLRAGQRLLPEALAAALSISQTPIKEALLMLERDGLIETVSHRGSVVRHFSPRDIVENYDARLLIELDAVTTGLRDGGVTDAFLKAVEANFAEHMDHAERRTLEHLRHAVRFDREFHALLVSLSGNLLVAGWHQKLLRHSQTFKAYSLETYDVDRTRAEHGAIVDALRRRSLPDASRALRRHLAEGKRRMVAARTAIPRQYDG
jgi:DNA-binding GntR family transcriptional regulator